MTRWRLTTHRLSPSPNYDGRGSTRNRSLWDGRIFDSVDEAERVALHIVESGYVEMAAVLPIPELVVPEGRP